MGVILTTGEANVYVIWIYWERVLGTFLSKPDVFPPFFNFTPFPDGSPFQIVFSLALSILHQECLENKKIK